MSSALSRMPISPSGFRGSRRACSDRGSHLQGVLDLRNEEAVAVGVEGGGAAGGARAAGTTDAVHVVLKRARQVQVNHVRNAGHIQPARGHVRRHQYLKQQTRRAPLSSGVSIRMRTRTTTRRSG
eukprot:3362159-Pyramimonas_sp.AAC.1